MEIQKPNKIIWHHTGIASTGDQFKQINEDHARRGFPISESGFYCGYHYLIERNGRIISARSDTEVGAHDQGENYDTIGVALAGDFNTQWPSEEQERAAALLTTTLRARHKIPVYRIEPHRWQDKTDCPGSKLADGYWIDNYLRREFSLFKRLILRLCLDFLKITR